MKPLWDRIDAGIDAADMLRIEIVRIELHPDDLEAFCEQLLDQARVKAEADIETRNIPAEYKSIRLIPRSSIPKDRARFVFPRGPDLDKWEAKAKHG